MIDINIYIESREKPEERLEEFASGDLWQQKTPLSLVKQVVDATGNDPAKLRSQSQSAHHAPHPTTMWSLMDTAYLKCSNCKIGYLI